jgi:hypothetical protein
MNDIKKKLLSFLLKYTVFAFCLLFIFAQETSFHKFLPQNLFSELNAGTASHSQRANKTDRHDFPTRIPIRSNNEKTPYKIEMYFAPSCSHCAEFFSEEFDTTYNKYIIGEHENRIDFDFVLVPFTIVKDRDKNFCVDVAIARICYLKGDFFKNIKLFLTQQKEWTPQKDLSYALVWKKAIKTFAIKHKFKEADIEKILESDNEPESVENIIKIVEGDKVRLPTIFIYHRKNGHYTKMKEIRFHKLDEALNFIEACKHRS